VSQDALEARHDFLVAPQLAAQRRVRICGGQPVLGSALRVGEVLPVDVHAGR
jgi:hypothetical protein